MQTQTGEKPYSCQVHQKVISQSSSFKRHMQKHNEEKLFLNYIPQYFQIISIHKK